MSARLESLRGLAGSLRKRVVIRRRADGADALGAADGSWAEVARAWAAIAPEAEGASYAADARSALPVWRMTLRPCPVAVGDRIERNSGAGGGTSEVRAVRRDPRLPDRVVAIAEEMR